MTFYSICLQVVLDFEPPGSLLFPAAIDLNILS